MQMTIEEVITESLEADNLQLQNMSTSKYVQVRSLSTVNQPECKKYCLAASSIVPFYGPAVEVQQQQTCLDGALHANA